MLKRRSRPVNHLSEKTFADEMGYFSGGNQSLSAGSPFCESELGCIVSGVAFKSTRIQQKNSQTKDNFGSSLNRQSKGWPERAALDMTSRNRGRKKNRVPSAVGNQPKANGEVLDTPPTALTTEASTEPAPSQIVARMKEETYLKERDKLIEIETKSAEQHDKAILTYTTGALALSITFLEKIAPNPRPDSLYLVACSWTLLILSTVCMVASFLTSQSACRRQRQLLDDEFSKDNVPKQDNRFSNWTSKLNVVSYFLFVFGVICLARFSWVNIEQKGKEIMDQQKNMALPTDTTRQLGHVPPTNPIVLEGGGGRGAVPPSRPVTQQPKSPEPANPKK